MGEAAYDRIGHGYSRVRRGDPRIAAQIWAALGDARSVVNVGAGAGSYEPTDRDVTAVEPSELMIAQRPEGAAPVVKAAAEALPFADDSFDAAMAIISDHHWDDRTAGLRELLRVARRRVLLLNADPGLAREFWLTRDYLPTFIELIPERSRRAGQWHDDLRRVWGDVDLQVVPVPHDCVDGFYHAYWRRPHAYLDEEIRAGISVFHLLPETEVARAMDTLGRDLQTGAWQQRYAHVRQRPALDVGLRLAVVELPVRTPEGTLSG